MKTTRMISANQTIPPCRVYLKSNGSYYAKFIFSLSLLVFLPDANAECDRLINDSRYDEFNGIIDCLESRIQELEQKKGEPLTSPTLDIEGQPLKINTINTVVPENTEITLSSNIGVNLVDKQTQFVVTDYSSKPPKLSYKLNGRNKRTLGISDRFSFETKEKKSCLMVFLGEKDKSPLLRISCTE